MASYTPDQLKGDGSPIEALTAATTYTFTLGDPASPGAAYFTQETKRNADGFYDTQPSNSLGLYDNFINLTPNYLITSSFISSVVVPKGGGSYDFTPTADVEVSSSFLRSTGGVTLTIEGGYIPTDATAIAYINQIQDVDGIPLTSTEKQAADELMLRMKGLDPLFSSSGSTVLFDQSIQICPMQGSNLTATKYNIINVAGTNQLYGGGVTANSDGITTNGVNGYINSQIKQTDYPTLITNTKVGIGMVLRDNQARFDMGTYSSGLSELGNLWMRGGNTTSGFCRSFSQDTAYVGGSTDPRGNNGFILDGVTSSKPKLYKNGVLLDNPTPNNPNSQTCSFEIPFAGLNFNGNLANLNNVTTVMFTYIFSGLTATEFGWWDEIIQAYMVTMGRKTW